MTDSYENYAAIVRKDTFNGCWAADLYKDGKIFLKAWQWGWHTKRDLVKQIEAMGIRFGSY